MTAIPAITLWEPWASLVAAGCKPFEFRRWDYRKRYGRLEGRRIAIHAGARPVRKAEVAELLLGLRDERGRGWGTALVVEPSIALLERAHQSPSILPLSHVLCTAVLGKPRPAADIAREVYGVERVNDSDRIDHAMWGWPLTDIERLEPPVPARGAQGFWMWEQPNA